MSTNLDPWAEKKIAKEAERRLSSAMRTKIDSLGFKNHVSQSDIKLDDVDAYAKTSLGKVPGGENLKLYMNGLSLKMAKHGFVQHYGVNGTRENINGRTRKIPRTTHYNFKNHIYRLPEKNFIDKAIQQSGVVPYVMERLTEVRCESVFVGLKNFIEKE